jgi:sialate O-acetylesterase
MQRTIFFLILFLATIAVSPAKVRLPAVLGSNMVLQRNSRVNIWGESEPDKNIAVTSSWNKKEYRTTTDNQGKWFLKIDTPEAGGPHSISISDGEENVSLENVMSGEVWICSGQSNMEMTIHGNYGEYTEHSTQTLLEAGKYPDIRLFKMGYVSAAMPQDDCPGTWALPTVENVSNFSAVAYHFARTMADVIHVPIGLISSNWGASSIEAWISKESMDKIGRNENIIFKNKPGLMKQKIPTALYNGMIHPIIKYTAKGFIWYQGEGNRADYKYYDKMMAEMVSSWRNDWENRNMPFYYVALAPHKNADGNDIDRPLLVESQYQAHKLIPYSGVAETSDIGDYYTIHPPKKREIGIRLALLALTNDYGINGIEAKGPAFIKADYGQDGQVTVSFENAPFGFRAERELSGFEIAGEDKKFYQAKAMIVIGKSEVKVFCSEVPKPVAVRYAFRNWCYGNLYNTSGIPAAPFRTDSWDEIK